MSRCFGALNLEWSPLANVAAVAAGLGLFLVGIVLLNRARGRRAIAIPQDVGKAELAGFVIVPAVLPLIFGGQWLQRSRDRGREPRPPRPDLRGGRARPGLDRALDAGQALVGQLRASLELFSRAMPLLFLFSVVLFLTDEVWQVFPTCALHASRS